MHLKKDYLYDDNSKEESVKKKIPAHQVVQKEGSKRIVHESIIKTFKKVQMKIITPHKIIQN